MLYITKCIECVVVSNGKKSFHILNTQLMMRLGSCIVRYVVHIEITISKHWIISWVLSQSRLMDTVDLESVLIRNYHLNTVVCVNYHWYNIYHDRDALWAIRFMFVILIVYEKYGIFSVKILPFTVPASQYMYMYIDKNWVT